jgi:STE24 endopeptidase
VPSRNGRDRGAPRADARCGRPGARFRERGIICSNVAVAGFSDDELSRARRFHRPRHLALVVETALAPAALAALTQLHLSLRWWVAALVLPAIVQLVASLVVLPVGCWRYRQDVRFGFSTQGPRGWLLDIVKQLAVGVVLTVGALALLFALAHRAPHSWGWGAAAGAAALVLVLGFLAPVVLEPVFNRFVPLAGGELAERLHALAVEAGVPVSEILVADASRRTTRQNAYVSGVGRTRRVVLWDTLLAAPADQIEVVLAHELGHRAHRHVVAFTLLGMGGAAFYVALLRLLRPHPVPHDTAFFLLVATLLDIMARPAVAALSRRFERAADRFSLELTRNRDAYNALHHDLAVANRSELQPPRWLYYWRFTHPTPIERLPDA